MIVSCGDSFFYGNDLHDAGPWEQPSNHTWPALLAHRFKKEYRSFSKPGVGNLQILQQFLRAVNQYKNSAVYIINWTWIDRHDYVKIGDKDLWQTTRPSLDDAERDPLYYKYFHSELGDKFSSLSHINHALLLLEKYKCQYVMTYMDKLLFDERWHAPDYVKFLQRETKSHLSDFNGLTFLEWSRINHYPESPTWHPLEKAHEEAADFWASTIKELL